jgi:alanyl-tRNA synthetase
MTGARIRKAFLDFFDERGHTIVPSSPLIPQDDPTLLFVNAGMVQFKNAFLGLERRPYVRAASAQRCLRVSGKHNDLEQVGPSPWHLTLFEMLGNFSFGDYFKDKAISFAWEFVTGVLKIPKERLIITVHSQDREAYKHWKKIPISQQQILHLGDKTNFWSMGPTGPCGPTSEIHYDRGRESCTCGQKDCSVALDNGCERWLEIWNLVFMEFDQTPQGLFKLPKPGIDTGMGLERITSVMQRTSSIYDTDLFKPIIDCINKLTKRKGTQTFSQTVAHRVIADHSRAISFLLADGVLPSNEKQGYVLRMIIRRAIRFGKKLGLERPFLGEVVKAVIDIMGRHYSELAGSRDFILKVLLGEEERFKRTLDEGLERLSSLIAKLKREGKGEIPGDEVFKLYDTYGFPLDLTRDVAEEQGFTIDQRGFEREMERQKERSRKLVFQEIVKVRDKIPTEFSYDKFALQSKVISTLDEQDKERPLIKGEKGAMIFEKTPFYAEAGGQVADQGIIKNLTRKGKALVSDVQAEGEVFLHLVRVEEGEFHQGDLCLLEIDIKRRKNIACNHTATHILHGALREVLGYKQGIQTGSLVGPDELRFDFTHPSPLAKDEIKKVGEIVNEVIFDDLPVSISKESLEEAKAKGAIALFEEYKEKVRVVTIGDGFSVELCGGTHVKHTGEIGLFKIISEEGIASGVRRIKAATREGILKLFEEKEKQLDQIAKLLAAPQKDAVRKLEGLLLEKKKTEEELSLLKGRVLSFKAKELLKSARSFEGIQLICEREDASIEELKQLADLLERGLKGKGEEGIIILGSGLDGKAAIVCKVSDKLRDRFHAGEIIRKVAKIVGGGGGGSSGFAQGGGSDPSKLKEALEEGMRIVQKQK